MKIAYFGGDMFYSNAEYLIKQSDHDVIRVYTGEKNESERRMTLHIRALANDHAIPIFSDKPTAKDIQELSDLECDMILVSGYGYKIPDWEGGHIKYAVNAHPSLLPVGAGAMSMPQVFLRDVKETGLTLHKVASDWDTGDIILQKSVTVANIENYETLLRWNQKTATALLKEFLKNPEQCWSNATPQDMSKFDYWPVPKAEDVTVDYTTDPVEIIAKKLRYHRFVNNMGHVEYIKDIKISSKTHSYSPGTLLSQENEQYKVACRGGIIRFTSVLDINPKP